MRLISCPTLNPFATISFPKLNLHIDSSITVPCKSKFNCDTSVSNRPCEQRYEQLLEASVLSKNLILGMLIHSKIIINGLEKDSFLTTKLIALYSACGSLLLAESIFNRVPSYNLFQVNAMIRGFSRNGLYQKALDFFYRKIEEGLEPDSYTFSCVLKACASLSDLCQGKIIHNLVKESGLDSDLFVSNALIAMYAKCGRLFDGILVFERMPHRDIVSWNSIVSAYIQNGFHLEAMVKVQELISSKLRPDHVTILSTLSIQSLITTVREIHGYVMRNGFDSTSPIRNSLISAYGKCGRLKEAYLLFNHSTQLDNVAWNAIISAHAQNDCFEESKQLLRNMKLAGFDLDVITYSGIISSFSQNGQSFEAMQIFSELLSSGLKPDVITIASILPAISDLPCSNYCEEIHAYSCRTKLQPDRRVGNALISAYSSCGSVQSAVLVFQEMTDRDVISWSSMVVGYVQNGCFNEALNTFRQMNISQIEPNPIAITSILSACTGISSLRQGKEIHQWTFKNGFEDQTFVGSALIDMYAKCGRIKDSRKVFDLTTEKNLVTWNSMMGGYAAHGLSQDALEVFWRVQEPDQISFITALSACNHGGLVDEGIKIFNSMKRSGVSPREGHYACMVDMLGRSGRLNEALHLIRTMPMEANADIWGALLGACKIHSNLEIAIYAGARIMESGCQNPGYYVLLSNILADFGRWEEVEAVRKTMKEKGVKKGVASSWIE